MLNDREQAFCREYLKDFNASAAYTRAGYASVSDGARRRAASALLQKPEVAAELTRLKAEVAEKWSGDVAELRAFWKGLITADLVQIFDGKWQIKDPGQIPEALRPFIQSVSITAKGTSIRFADKLRASELLARQCGAFDETEEDTNTEPRIHVQMVVKSRRQIAQEASINNQSTAA